MKKTIYSIAFTAMLAGAIFTSCQSKQEKVEEAKEDVADAKENLQEAKRELNAEYPTYRKDMDERINANQKEIDRLKTIVNKPGEKPLDQARRDRIDDLERKNADLRARLYGYENERSDWEAFKREFNHDMDEFGNSIRDAGKDNVR
jgi:chromosome segregation ATPase